MEFGASAYWANATHAPSSKIMLAVMVFVPFKTRSFVHRRLDKPAAPGGIAKPPIQKRKQRSFRCFRVWRATQDSNLRPLAPEANALSS
jgi:hypothetical protein